MDFETFYRFNEAKIIHKTKNITREVNKAPTIVPLPKEFVGKRLVTIVNDDKLYFTFAFKPDSGLIPKPEESLAFSMGNAENPTGTISTSPPANIKELYAVYYKHYTDVPNEHTPMTYNGEVRIRPPFIDYQEYPQDKNVYYFDDFESDNVYFAGRTIEDELTPEQAIAVESLSNHVLMMMIEGKAEGIDEGIFDFVSTKYKNLATIYNSLMMLMNKKEPITLQSITDAFTDFNIKHKVEKQTDGADVIVGDRDIVINLTKNKAKGRERFGEYVIDIISILPEKIKSVLQELDKKFPNIRQVARKLYQTVIDNNAIDKQNRIAAMI